MKAAAGSASLDIAPSPSAWARLAAAGDEKDYFSAWLELVCTQVPGVHCGVVVLGAPDTGPYAPRALWPGGQGGAPRLAEVAERALAERRSQIAPVPADPQRRGAATWAIAAPVEIDGHLHGVVALEVGERPGEALEGALQSLQLARAWVDAYVLRQSQGDAQAGATRLMAVIDLVAAVLEEERFDASCRSLVTELAMRLNCDRVGIGVVRRGRAEVVALSHSAQVGKRMNLTHAVGAAMDEAIDQKSVIRYPAEAGDGIVVTRDHEQLAVHHGSGSVLTVPVAAGEALQGALTLERPASMPFRRDEIELCQSVGAVVARILELKRRDERALAVRAMDALGEQLRRFAGPRYVKRKIALAAVALAAVFFTFAMGDYRVSAPATLEGSVRRSLAAPFDGYVATAPLRAGDVARAGAVLATLDDRDLRLERLKWESQFAQYVNQQREATAIRDRAKAMVAEALIQQAQAQVALLDEQLSRAAIRAPFDGIVVRGDLSQSLGGAVKRGDILFELTPMDSYRVIVEVDERDIAEVAAGRPGTLVLASIAGESFPFTVKSVTSVTTAREGRNFFRVEGALDVANERLRPGMEGVAKVEVERRRLIWIWTHRFVDWARLFVWTHLP